jgi:hypothetical protein
MRFLILYSHNCGSIIINCYLQAVDTKEYFAALSKLGMNIGANNFLIFQGQIEQLALKRPKELTTFFEKLSRYLFY